MQLRSSRCRNILHFKLSLGNNRIKRLSYLFFHLSNNKEGNCAIDKGNFDPNGTGVIHIFYPFSHGIHSCFVLEFYQYRLVIVKIHFLRRCRPDTQTSGWLPLVF